MLALKNLAENTTIFSRSVRLMGTEFNFDLVTDNAVWALQRIESAVNEINRIEKLLSTFNEESSINLINRNAGIAPVKVDAETFKLIDRAIQISALTYGSFDIAYGIPASKEHEGTVVIKTRTLKKKISLTNYTNIDLDQAKQTVFLKNTNMRISLSALARGYAADKAKVTLQMEGVSSGVINIAGDLLTWGLQPDGSAWTIAAADSTKANEIYSHVEISNMAVVTSVNPDLVANRAVINAESGFPVSAIKSISIISPTAELSGAMTGPMFGMGINTGLYLVNKLNQIACIAVDDHERVYTSKHIKL
ncbi:FAD:protein FMN transferase [Mucilaginibacter achroorhodeus]|uniref:FAD:protein FMN transferase n=1 Tax=Mucilaginibacter achroorhodeus TaxID=2599294 RepID=A0A563TZM9_9SPHI|nr:FAD:protein FMN transferase [Mucilaginibacter achroorhodeus]TWR24212.1 FAD:protein FMN transferase [Mucilaginibacter achroorhodeus]